MAFSYVKRSGNGTQKAFTFSFTGQDEGYFRDEDLVVVVDGALASFSLTSSNTLELSVAPPAGEDNVLIRRVMPKDVPYADFKRGNNFGQEVLNNSFLQLLYIVHESLDGFFPEGYTIQSAIRFIEDATIDGNLYVNGKAEVTDSDQSVPDSVVNFREGDDRYKEPLESEVIERKQEDSSIRDELRSEDSSIRDELRTEDSRIRSEFGAADANIQSQLAGEVPLEASAFSPISWHDPIIENSVTIPENKNAWSFGPTINIDAGQTITLGLNSFWTIANGDQATTYTKTEVDGLLDAKAAISGQAFSGNISAPNLSGTNTGDQTLSEIGVGQTWQDVSGSRSDGVTYTNSTGKPIFVFVKGSASGSGRIKVDGHVFDWSVLGATDEAGTAIVPAGSTYEYIDNFVTVLELR